MNLLNFFVVFLVRVGFLAHHGHLKKFLEKNWHAGVKRFGDPVLVYFKLNDVIYHLHTANIKGPLIKSKDNVFNKQLSQQIYCIFWYIICTFLTFKMHIKNWVHLIQWRYRFLSFSFALFWYFSCLYDLYYAFANILIKNDKKEIN